MRCKDCNTGLRGVLFEARHYERMGTAIWLYGWLVLRQTHEHGGVGCVLRGAPISYREIEGETGFNSRTLERWTHTLRRHGYVETEAAPAGIIVRITRAKRFSQAGRNLADRLPKVARAGPRNSGVSECNPSSNQQVANQIGCSFVVRLEERKERETENDFHGHFHRPNSTSEIPNPCSLDQTPKTTPNPDPTIIHGLPSSFTANGTSTSHRASSTNCCAPGAKRLCGASLLSEQARRCTVHEFTPEIAQGSGTRSHHSARLANGLV
jgi:hypothetical protein